MAVDEVTEVAVKSVIGLHSPPVAQTVEPLAQAVVGVLVHNEEPNIENCLLAILNERVGDATARSVVVVSSGSTDRTEELVRRIASYDNRVRLIVEPERSGKANAVNILLQETSEPIVVLVGGDILFVSGALGQLVEPFRNPLIGMTGARPVPTNHRRGLVGQTVHVLWDVHHELALRSPKLGEAVAFRRVLTSMDPRTITDEAMLEHLVRQRGMRLRYVPSAVVRNHGPETLSDYVAQRTRNYEGHLRLASRTGYRVSSMRTDAAVRALWGVWRKGTPARYVCTAVVIEGLARGLAHLAVATKTSNGAGMWRPIRTSKVLIADGQRVRAHHDGVRVIYIRTFDPQWRAVSRARRNVLRLIRGGDRLARDRGGLTITIRGDDDAARALQVRLQRDGEGFVAVLPPAPLFKAP